MYLNIKSYNQEAFLKFYKTINQSDKTRKENDIVFDEIIVDNVKITFYKNLTILFNGKLTAYILSKIDVLIDKQMYVGVDEVGVGENIGPFVVCGVAFKDYENKKKVVLNGIKDSKKLEAKDIVRLSKIIKESSDYICITKEPKTFNKEYFQIKNMKEYNAILQNNIHNNFKSKNYIHVTDQFVNENKYNEYLKKWQQTPFSDKIIFTTKAEDKYVEVAAAAILAKDIFNNWVISYCEKNNIHLEIKKKLSANKIWEQIKNKEIILKNEKEFIKEWKK